MELEFLNRYNEWVLVDKGVVTELPTAGVVSGDVYSRNGVLYLARLVEGSISWISFGGGSPGYQGYEVQEPFIQDYNGSGSVTLPVVPKTIFDIWMMSTTANPYYLTKDDYTINGAIVTPTNPVFVSGMKIKINYTA